nr:uncharacterized protein LOC117452278 [Pseudochaenichthys georgianus]
MLRHRRLHPPLPSSPPSTPFEAVFADFFDYGGRHYLVVGDRLSGWVEVLSSTAGTALAGSAGLVQHLRSFFATFGVPEELSSDGGPEFKASHTEDFLRLWHVKHRVSSVSFPQSNGRAEVAVKTAKRLLMSNTGPSGGLDQDRFLRAMLQLRNTPDPDCNLSPAQIIFGRPLRGSLSFVARSPSSGIVVESPGHDQYRIRVDGSGRLTLRNRRFLRAYTPATPCAREQPAVPLPPPAALDHQPPPIHPGWATPQGIAQRPAVGPRDSAMGASPL